jgi:hypothetical protein
MDSSVFEQGNREKCALDVDLHAFENSLSIPFFSFNDFRVEVQVIFFLEILSKVLMEL